MSASNRDVGDLLETVDKHGRRLWVYADIVSGKWRTHRRTIAAVLITGYLILPWLKWNGLQLIQFNLIDNRLIIFGSILDFSESFVVLTAILSFVFATIAFTSIAGRVWCGWTCPQTVFLDFIFRPIEKWIEGRPLERKRLDHSDVTIQTLYKKFLKWSLYAVASFIIANTFVAYFAGSSALLSLMTSSPMQNLTLFLIMLLVFLGFLFNFGWFREQMCTLVCPYGRLQSVLLDKNSYVVGYDKARGEPRGKNNGGDCVDCNRCVQVCPTGIDIRNGIQLECINCAACIDACNIVMSKINKPPNLIGYTTENERAKAKLSKLRFIRPIIYLTIAIIFSGLTVKNIFFRQEFRVTELKSRSLTIVSDGAFVRNQFGFDIKNQSNQTLFVSIQSPSNTSLFTGQNPVAISAGGSSEVQIFVQIKKSDFLNGIANTKLTFSAGTSIEDVNITLLNREDGI